MVKYYQWVPLILLALALSFLLPRFVYRFLSKQSGVDLLNVADASLNYVNVDKFDKRRKILTYLSNTIHFYSSCNKSKRLQRGFTSSSSSAHNNTSRSGGNLISTNGSGSKPHLYKLICCHGKLNGSYLSVLYLLTKLSYIGNILAQLFLLNIILGFDYNSQGMILLKDLSNKVLAKQTLPENKINLPNDRPLYIDNFNIRIDPLNTQDSQPISLANRYFPRESACDFRVRMNLDSLVHNFTVQCALPINLFNEQLFTLLWVWLWFIVVINLYDLFNWLLRVLPGSRFNYIRDRIRFRNTEMSSKRILNSFVYDYLSLDGVFVLRLLSLNASDSVTYDIVQVLWQNYSDICKYSKPLNSPICLNGQPQQQRTQHRSSNTKNNDYTTQYTNRESV
jgi:innexin